MSPEGTAKRKKKLKEEEEARWRTKEKAAGVGVGEPVPETPPKQPAPGEIFRDPQGNIVGIKEGEKFLMGFEQDEAQRYLQRRTGKIGGEAGAGAGGAGAAGGFIEAPQAAALREQQKEMEQIEEGRQRLISEEMPERVSLAPPELGATTWPLVGGIARQVAQRMIDLAAPGDGKTKQAIKKQLGFATEEDIRQMAISDIQKKELEKGLTTSEKLGSLIEGLPGAKWLNKWFDVETPRGNLEEVMQDIKGMRRSIMNIETNVKTGWMPLEVAQLKIKTIEDYINYQEQRLKLLIINSPSLEFNTDRIIGFETDILIVRERLFQAKLNILAGAEKDPTMMDAYLKQQEQSSPEWASEEW